MTKLSWIKEKSKHKDFEVIKCKSFDPYKDWLQDNGCYVLIKLKIDTQEICVAVCNYKHEILKEFRGKKAQDLYFSIFEYEQEHNLNWFTRKDHIAYLGKELKKAEIALSLGTNYYQE